MAERRKQGLRELAVRRDLRRLASLEGVESYAALALELAKTMDGGGLEPKDEARYTSELRRTLIELGRVAIKAPATDGVDELRERRSRRRGA